MVHPKPAVEPRTPAIPHTPEGKQELIQFIQNGHKVIDTWTSAVREAASRLLQLEEEKRRQADWSGFAPADAPVGRRAPAGGKPEITDRPG